MFGQLPGGFNGGMPPPPPGQGMPPPNNFFDQTPVFNNGQRSPPPANPPPQPNSMAGLDLGPIPEGLFAEHKGKYFNYTIVLCLYWCGVQV